MAEYAFLRFPAEAIRVDDELYQKLPDSSRRIFDAIRAHGPMTHEDLRNATGLPARTIRFGLSRLKGFGFVDSLTSLRDSRICYFFVNRRCVEPNALENARANARRTRSSDEEEADGPLVTGSLLARAPAPTPVEPLAQIH